ncbi:peroxiredoxin family protein [Winogradskyella litorisediminis]|uniref:Peroxiredoxin family protein n=1 Tax=Winogradskyella litorisediminis TaxID=1156618 RepID=A0ABW3N2W6_9FLAO
MRYFSIFLLALILVSCKDKTTSKTLDYGTYRFVLQLQDDQELPFIVEVDSQNSLTIFNAEEQIEVDEIEYKNDSIFIKAPVFEGYLAGKFMDNSTIKGNFINESLDRVVPFYANYGRKERFNNNGDAATNVSGVWETVFSKGIEGDEYIAKGVFEQKDGKVTGTFRTTTGDYRYLEGVLNGNRMELSTFDGAHAFLFTAEVTDSTMNGTFYSGNHWKEPFVAKRNSDYELPSANSLTFLKDGYESLEFTFPDANGNQVSLSDERFKDKVVVVQIMGTWCPNCLDESKYYADFYSKNKDKDLEIIALAFESAKTKEKAFNRIERLTSKVGIVYPVLLAQYGTYDKEKAAEKLPMLNHILSYPTSIFVDKTGKVRKIHTGFNGPATGEKYTEFKNEFEGFIETLLNE